MSHSSDSNSHNARNMAEDLHVELAQKYSLRADAEALLFKDNNDEPSFRLEITNQGWEFSDGRHVGTDLRGIFYYNRGLFREKLSKDRVTHASYHTHQKKAQGKLFLHVEFFAPHSKTELWGEFLAEDKRNVSESTGLLHRHKEGGWRKVGYVIADATASKAKNDKKITIKCEAGGEVVEVECNAGDKLYEDVIDDVYGRLWILGNLDTLQKATSVNWYHDHVVFHEGDDAKDYSAFFLVDEESPDDLHWQCPLGNDCKKALKHVEIKPI